MPVVSKSSGSVFMRFGISVAIWIVLWSSAAIASEETIYSFNGGKDGTAPCGQLIADKAGNLYGVTGGGGRRGKCQGQGCGTVYEIAPNGSESVLYAFRGGSDGAFSQGSLIIDDAGNLYGTTQEGGTSNGGTVFKLAPDGTKSVLHSFMGGEDGLAPSAYGGLIADGNHRIYGVTVDGGTGPGCGSIGCGTIFSLTTGGTEKVIYTFCSQTNCSDGANPLGKLARDQSGSLFGTTVWGGSGNPSNCGGGSLGCGTVFKIAPDGTETVLHSFQGDSDGYAPYAGLIMDDAGNLFGTTSSGGSGGNGFGTVFEIAADGTETVLHVFQRGDDGAIPVAGVVADKAGNLYGATYYGGSSDCEGRGCGVIFRLAPDGTETILFAFTRRQGKNPIASLLIQTDGTLYGTTLEGGHHNNGVVFGLMP